MKLVNKLVLAFMLLSLMLLAAMVAQPVVAGEVIQANLGKEGQNINPKSLVVPGRSVVVSFYSPFSPPSLELTSRLEQLAAKTPLIVMKVNINRPSNQGVDLQSPVAMQFGLKTVPYLVLLDPQGKMIAEGQKAMETIKQQLQEAGIAGGESPAQRAFKGSATQPAPAPAQAQETETSPPTLATARKAKLAQGLKGYIFQDRNSKKFFLEDRDGNTYKFEGSQWVKLGGQESPVKAQDKVQAPAQTQAPAKEAAAGPPTIDTVRKAKKAQGLDGYIFQDRNSQKFFLEDSDGNTYKFEGGQWVKIN
jgi:thiol-disulfide isomerase/thioredoxin